VIRRKERELAHRLEEARQAAEKRVAQARQAAEEWLLAAERGVVAEAQACYDQAMADIEAEATVICNSGSQYAVGLWEQGQDHVPEIADIVVEWVLPEVRPETAREPGRQAYATAYGQGTGHQHGATT
jgi:vacuolar-type H+-ATPase subunit H